MKNHSSINSIMKEHKNISDELLIAYIEGNLNDEEAMIIEGYIDSDSRIFSRYAILNRSLRQIEETELRSLLIL